MTKHQFGYIIGLTTIISSIALKDVPMAILGLATIIFICSRDIIDQLKK